ncbi:MAG: SDR family oxidoreductase [Gammaproteobacteria bacterium]|nr:SDR family oxidoreductase [Gammaproteobacteria bacterium]
MTDVAGKRVLITGGASGIGCMLAEQLAARGAAIVVWDIDSDGLDAITSKLRDQGHEAHSYQCDLSDRRAIAATAAAMRDADLHVDVLINNAGIVSGDFLLDLTDEHIERTFAVNTMALFWTTREFLPGMINNGAGHIVTIASAAGFAGTAKMVDYSASKFAAVGFDDALRVELKSMGTPVTTTVVCPFYIDTGMFHGVKTRFSWLLPILDADYAVTRIADAIQRNRHRLIMPRMVMSVFLMRLFPVAVQDAMMKFLGVTTSMEDFVGREPH